MHLVSCKKNEKTKTACGAEKMFGFYETAPCLYTVKLDGNYSIDFQGEPGAVTIPLSYKAGADGSYTLIATQLESFTSSTAIKLGDKQTAKMQNLMQNPVYTFTSVKTDDAARFLLHFWRRVQHQRKCERTDCYCLCFGQYNLHCQ